MMYPLKLKPALKSYIWGGNKLKTEFGFESSEEKVAEAWVMSCNPDGESVIINGELQGKPLSYALSLWGLDQQKDFPLLIKFLDANDFLSVQVHPDDDTAKRLGAKPKNEMWYVLDAADDAFLYCGLNRNVSREELRELIVENRILEVLNKVRVRKGDCLYIPAGTVHSIGKGLLIAEVQQDSNTTFRVYDFDRVDKYGNKRELHIKEAIESINTSKFEKRVTSDNSSICSCEYFKVSLLNINGMNRYISNGLTSLIFLSGKGTITCNNCEIKAEKGDSILIPPKTETVISGNAEILVSKV